MSCTQIPEPTLSCRSLRRCIAGVDIAANQRGKLERLCRYISRPPIATERLALTTSGQVRYRLTTRSRRRGFSFWVAWRAAAAKKRKTFSGKKQN